MRAPRPIPAVPAQRGMPDRVHASVDPVQAARFAPGDGSLARVETKLEQLPVGDHAVLPAGEFRHRPLTSCKFSAHRRDKSQCVGISPPGATAECLSRTRTSSADAQAGLLLPQQALRLAPAAEGPQRGLAVLRHELRQRGQPACARARGREVERRPVRVQSRHQLVDPGGRRQRGHREHRRVARAQRAQRRRQVAPRRAGRRRRGRPSSPRGCPAPP